MPNNFPLLGEMLALLCAIIWAAAVIMFRKSGETIHPLALSVFKNLLAFALFLPTMGVLGQAVLRPAPIGDYLLLLFSGVLGLGLGDTLFFVSLNYLGAGLTSIVGCLYSPFIIALAVLYLGETLTPLQIIGAVSIITAILIATLKIDRGGVTKRNLLLGIAFGASGTAATSVGVIIIKPLLEQSPLLWATEVRLAGGVAALLIVLGLHPARRKIIDTLRSTKKWFYPIAGAVLGAYLAMVIWLGGMKYTQASVASVLNQTSSVFVFLLAVIFLREPVNFRRVVGILLAFAGVFMVSFG